MSRQLTEFLLRLTFEGRAGEGAGGEEGGGEGCGLSSSQLLTRIYSTLDSSLNRRPHKLSLASDDTAPTPAPKCNCKKSKCLKLYCECFARGSFCEGCSCECCHNRKERGEQRARAIDEMLGKASLPFGGKGGQRGCNCRKTGCQKKYCECFNQGVSCGDHCKCSNCENCGSDSS